MCLNKHVHAYKQKHIYTVCVCVCIPVGRPAERHTAADVGAAVLCGAARCFPAVSGGVALRV